MQVNEVTMRACVSFGTDFNKPQLVFLVSDLFIHQRGGVCIICSLFRITGQISSAVARAAK